MSPTTQGAQLRPTLIYDGDCGICKKWVTYWEGLTGARVVYRPYQYAAQDYPDIPLDAFRHAIQFVETDAHVIPAPQRRTVSRYAPGRQGWCGFTPAFRVCAVAEWATRSLRVAATC
jgi:hypothetical protein